MADEDPPLVGDPDAETNFTIKEPTSFCNIFPGIEGGLSISLPFGLPQISAPDVSCQGLSIMCSDLGASLTAFFPLIKIVACILKIIDVLEAIPDALGPPPQPQKILSALAELAECIEYFLGITGSIIQPFCRFIRDLMNILLFLCQCLRSLFTVTLAQDAEIAVLQASADLDLAEFANCLIEQNDKLKLDLEGKLNTMQLLIDLINIFISALPPVKAAIGTINLGANDFSPEGLATLEEVFTSIRDIAAACA